MKTLRTRLAIAGVNRKFLDRVVLPAWWEDTLAATPGGLREAAGYICAHLGFSLHSLLDASQKLTFAHTGQVKYKKAKDVTEHDITLTTHYALGAARAVASAYAGQPAATVVSAPQEWRNALLGQTGCQWIQLEHILKAAWEMGIPVLHLHNLPDGAKKPDALTTMVGDRPVIVVFSGRKSPSWVAFIVAHELGHVFHKHLKAGQTLVDEKIQPASEEKEERLANDFASRLLTGQSDLGLHSGRSLGVQQLADAATKFGAKYRIAPGVAALNYGFTTGFWAAANGAVTCLEKHEDAAKYFAKALSGHLAPDDVTEESWEWLTRTTTTVE